MFNVVVTLTTRPAVGLTQFNPTVSPVDGAAELFWIHERLHDQDGVRVLFLPILTEPIQRQSKNPGTEVGHIALGEDKEPAIVSDETASTPKLFAGPTDPVISMFEVVGGRIEKQNGQPIIGRIGGDVVEPLSHGSKASEVVVLIKQLADSGQLLACGEVHTRLVQERLLVFVRQSDRFDHARR